jgi:hypothetical protein
VSRGLCKVSLSLSNSSGMIWYTKKRRKEEKEETKSSKIKRTTHHAIASIRVKSHPQSLVQVLILVNLLFWKMAASHSHADWRKDGFSLLLAEEKCAGN